MGNSKHYISQSFPWKIEGVDIEMNLNQLNSCHLESLLDHDTFNGNLNEASICKIFEGQF